MFKYFLEHVFQCSAGPIEHTFLHDMSNMHLKSYLFNILRYEKYDLSNPTTITKTFPVRKDRADSKSSYCISLTTEIFLSTPYFSSGSNFYFSLIFVESDKKLELSDILGKKKLQIILIYFSYINIL